MNKTPKNHTPNRSKYKHLPAVMLCIFGVVFFVLGVLHFFDYMNVRHQLLDKRALDIAVAGKAFLSTDRIEAASQSGDVSFLKNSLSQLNNDWDGEYDTFIYMQNGNEIILLADSGSNAHSDHDFSTNEQFKQALTNGEPTVMDPYTDSAGQWAGVLVPIVDSHTGKPEAVLGIRYPAFEWSTGLTTKAIDTGLSVVFFILLLVVVYHIYKQNHVLAGIGTKLQLREDVFKMLIDSLPIGVAIGQSGDLANVTVNKKFGDVLGIGQSDLAQMTIDELIKTEEQQLSGQKNEPDIQDAVSSFSTTKRILKHDGQTAWINMHNVSMNQVESTSQGIAKDNYLCIIEDVTERILMETALRESERSKAVILAHLPGMAYRCRHDREWTMLFVSEGCENLTGYKPESLLYNNDLSFNDLIAVEYREELWREWERILALNIPFQGEYEIVAKNGARKWVMEMGQGIYDVDGNVVALEGLIIDMTAKKLSEDQIKHMSDHDFLTGQYNRKYFEEEKVKMQENGSSPVSIIMANINGVRLINDAFGHAEGDRVIIEAASILKHYCREGDILARTGGDEFSLLLPDTGAQSANDILQNINRACERYNSANPNRRYDISLTLGCGTANQGESAAKAYKDAEESMHNHKLLNRKSSHSTILSSVMATMFERSQETEEHAERLGQLSKGIGEMLNLPQKNLVELELFSMLHDIGKVGIDDRILNKPDKLTEEEWAVMRKHPEIGYRIAMSSPELEPIAEYILSHHERWDGKGYPQGLKQEEIPLLSRILAVADAYDAMTEDRVYRKALTKQAALEEIQRNAGTQFDPMIAQKFVESMK